MTEKRCSKCKEWKFYSEFYKNKSQKDGYHNQCNICSREHNRKYHSENCDLINKRKQEYYKCNKEVISKRQSDYYQENRNRILELNRKWRQENPERLRAYSAKHRGIKASVSTSDLWESFEIDVLYNNCPSGYHVDHIIPLKLGGRHELSNLQHLECSLNCIKQDKHPDDWDDPRPISCRA